MPEGRSVEEQIALEKLMWETWPGYAAKVLWRAKVIEWLHRTQPDEKFISLLTRYSDGQASAIREFERAARLMQHEEQNSSDSGRGGFKRLLWPGKSWGITGRGLCGGRSVSPQHPEHPRTGGGQSDA